MPGKQVKTGHIEAIPEPSKIGPYRNIVIHTGVNSINSHRFRKSNRALIENFESKIRSISEMYPKARIFVSLLLPSKSVPLNYRIRDFNNLLLDLTCRLNRVFIIEHSMFGICYLMSMADGCLVVKALMNLYLVKMIFFT